MYNEENHLNKENNGKNTTGTKHRKTATNDALY